MDPGFDPVNLYTARLWLPQPNLPETGPYFEHAARVRLVRPILERLAGIPGVESAAVSSMLPLDGDRPVRRLEIEGRAMDGGEMPSALYSQVSSRYFDAMRIPLVRGRLFREEDREESEPVAIVSERFALQYFPGEDPIGRRLRGASRGNPQEFRTIVGVVADIRVEALETEPRPHYYSPIEQESDLAMAFVVRTAGARPGISEEIASAVRFADPDLPVYLPRSMEEVTIEGLRDRRLAARLTAGFALVALALAVLGIYGVTSYGARRRTREVGIRMALGAERGEILKMVVARGMRLALVGIALGLVLALSAARLLTSLLYEVSPADPASFLGIAFLLAGSAFAASYLPARRAARLDPLTALRHE